MGKPVEISIVDVKAMPVEEKSALSVSPAAELCKAALIAESRKDSEAGVYECVVPLKLRVRLSLADCGKAVGGIYNRSGTILINMDDVRVAVLVAAKEYTADNLVKPEGNDEWMVVTTYALRNG